LETDIGTGKKAAQEKVHPFMTASYFFKVHDVFWATHTILIWYNCYYLISCDVVPKL